MTVTTIQQGRFTSDGTAELIEVRSGVDWMEVINETQWATQQTPGRGVKFEWQRGIATGHAFEFTKADGSDTLQAEKVTSGGFTLIGADVGASAPVTGTTITKSATPVCTAANHGFENGDSVYFTDMTNMSNIAGVLSVFTIKNVTTNTFELSFFNTNTANFVAETGFTVRSIPFFDWRGSWTYPSAVTTGTTTQIQFTTNEPEEEYSIGTVFSFNVPREYGMTELNGLQGTVLAFDSATNTYTVDIDSSSFTAFVWPATSSLPFSIAQVVIVGTEGITSVDAVTNVQQLQIKLGAGIDGPAGSSGDVIYWKAGSSSSVTNE